MLNDLRTKQNTLVEIERNLQNLESIYDQSVAEKNKLELNINRTQARLKRSDLLVVALSDEQHRWEKNIKVYNIFSAYVKSNLVLTNAFYLDVFPASVDCNR